MDHIFEHLDIAACIVSQVDSNVTLASLARTSQAISKLALNRLWHTIDSVVLLGRCMPPDYWDEMETYTPFPANQRHWCGNAPRGVYTSQIDLSAKEREQDWLGQRFTLYAARIRSLSTENRRVDREKRPIRGSQWKPSTSDGQAESRLLMARLCDYDVTSSMNPQVFLAWHAYSRDVKPLFPNLTRLKWAAHGAHDLDLIAPFIVPSLRHLALNTVYGYHAISGSSNEDRFSGATATIIIKTCVSSCVNLRSLDLLGTEIDVPMLETVLKAHLKQLIAFRCSVPLSHQFVRFIATLPHLESLHITVQPRLGLNDILHIFPALRKLSIGDIPWDVARSYILAIRSNRLQSLELSLIPRYECEAWPTHVDELFHTIGTHSSTQLLQNLRLRRVSTSESLSRGQPRQKYPAGPEALKHILGLSHLTHIELDEPCTNQDIPIVPDMLRSLPRLEHMNISGSESVSLGQFIEIVHCLPSLRSLGGLDVMCDLDVPLPISPGHSHPSLMVVRFRVTGGNMDIQAKQHELANYLITTFPFVQGYCTDSSEVNRVLQEARMKAKGIVGRRNVGQAISMNHTHVDCK